MSCLTKKMGIIPVNGFYDRISDSGWKQKSDGYSGNFVSSHITPVTDATAANPISGTDLLSKLIVFTTTGGADNIELPAPADIVTALTAADYSYQIGDAFYCKILVLGGGGSSGTLANTAGGITFYGTPAAIPPNYFVEIVIRLTSTTAADVFVFQSGA